MCCPSTNDKCYALMFSAAANAHYIIDVFSSPLVDLNLSIPGPAMLINSMSCSDTILALCNNTLAGPAVFRSYTLVASPSSITFLIDDTATPLCNVPAIFSFLYSNQVFFGYIAHSFYSVSASTLSLFPSGVGYISPVGYDITRCISIPVIC